MQFVLFLAALFTLGNAYEAECGQMTGNSCRKESSSAWDSISAVDEDDCRTGCRWFAAEHGDEGCCEWDTQSKTCHYNFRAGKDRSHPYRKATLCTTNAYHDRTQVDVICARKYYLKGFDVVPKRETCQQRCDARDECHTFCHSTRNVEWDCLLYTDCDEVMDKFMDGNWADTYECFEKPAGAEAASMLTAVTQPEAVESLMVNIFAAVGLLFVAFCLFHRFVASKPTETTPVPTENTPLETTVSEL